MTEEQIERRAERQMDKADNALLAGHISTQEYERRVRRINHWCNQQYKGMTNDNR